MPELTAANRAAALETLLGSACFRRFEEQFRKVGAATDPEETANALWHLFRLSGWEVSAGVNLYGGEFCYRCTRDGITCTTPRGFAVFEWWELVWQLQTDPLEPERRPEILELREKLRTAKIIRSARLENEPQQYPSSRKPQPVRRSKPCSRPKSPTLSRT